MYSSAKMRVQRCLFRSELQGYHRRLGLGPEVPLTVAGVGQRLGFFPQYSLPPDSSSAGVSTSAPTRTASQCGRATPVAALP
jgi:hypothetical protein